MKINYGKKIVINYFLILIFELIFKFFVMQTFDIGLFYIPIFSLFVSLIITFLTSLFKNKLINKIFSIVMYLFITFIFAAETVYYSFYKTICGIEALSYGGQVMEFASTIKEHIAANKLILLTLILLTAVLIVLVIKNKIENERFYFKETIILLIVSFMMIFTSLMYQDSSDVKNLLHNKNDLINTTSSVGLISSISLDCFKNIIGFEEELDAIVEREFSILEDKEYNMLNIDFKQTEDKTINNMNNYFLKQEPTNKNKYTGYFAGKNLVFIVAEGFYPIAVNEDITPTLYKLVNNGFVFNNYYQPIYNCSTSDGEFINDLSLLPGVSTCSMASTTDTYLPYSLGNIMDNYGYNTYAFHGWTYSYYGRQKTYPNLGYDYYGYDRYHKGYKNALKGIKDSWPTSDIDVINASYDIIDKNTNFVAYYMSISGHLEYNFSNAMSKKNKDAVKNIKASNSIKAYIASQVEFDKSLELLMAKLEEDNLLDDTVFVISADHYPYGLTEKEIMSYDKNVKNTNFDLYKNNLIIYNSKMEPISVDKYSSSLDVLPTVLNLFGVKYDSRLLMGSDIFSESEGLVIFNNRSWITDKGRFDYRTKKFEKFTDEELDKNYINNINKIVSLKFQMSKLIITKDYYRKVLGD